MDERTRYNLLYDFYQGLLTNHQRIVYESFIIEDLSVSEIADRYNISRQAVSDALIIIQKKLGSYEEKLKLLEKFLLIKKEISFIKEGLLEYKDILGKSNYTKIESKLNKIIEKI